ncbi:MAG: tetratricopeptide repeat protein [Gemmataceae bacterium]
MNDVSGSRSDSMEDLVAEVVDQFMERVHRGERPRIEDYTERHPEAAALLRQILPALQVLQPLSEEAGALAPAERPGGQAGPLGDFRILREVGRGGMGIVYEAEQISLGRRVALKVLPFAATMDPRQLQRFQNEARAAAALEHPHIVPVYGVGAERGVYYYAMRLIDGQTLANLIARRHPAAPAPNMQAPTTAHVPAPNGPAPNGPAEPTAPVAAASTERAPRDAAFFQRAAEWGIQAAEGLEYAHGVGIVHRDIKPANLMIDGGGKLWITDFGLARTAADSGLTMTGDVLGTLRYMSPEQALAKHGLVDHRTDIYALGATLYELLTGQPAVEGPDRREILHKIAEEEPSPPRQWNRAIPIDLETIVLKALAKNPAERYATAQELADDLRRFHEDHPIRARRPSLIRRLRGWRRRHKPLATGVGAVLLTVLLLGGTALWRQQVREAATEQAVSEDLREAERLQKLERWAEALQALERASGRLANGGSENLREQVQRRRQEVALVAQLEEARLSRWNLTGDRVFGLTESDRAYQVAFATHGLDLEMLGSEEMARRVRESAIHTQLVAALDDWALTKEGLQRGSGEGVRAVVRLADDDPWRQQLRAAKDQRALERLVSDKEVLTQPPASLVQLALALGNREGRARLLRQAQLRYPADFWINHYLAHALSDPAEASGFFRAALALRPQSAGLYYSLGVTLSRAKKLPEAVDAFRRAVELKPSAGTYEVMARTLRDQGKLAEAVDAFRKAIELKPNRAIVYHELGYALYLHKKLPDAVDAYRKAIEFGDAGAYFDLGNALGDQGKLAEAVTAFRKAIELKPNYAEGYIDLGNALCRQKKLPEAVAAHRKAIELKPDYADAYICLGADLHAQKKLAEAVAAIRKAIELKPDYAIGYSNLGIVLGEQGNLAESIAAYRDALRLQPDMDGALNSLSWNLATCPDIKLQDPAQAVELAIKAVKLKPNEGAYWNTLGTARYRAGDWKAAITDLERSMKLRKGGDAGDWFFLAMSHWRLGDKKRAEKYYQEAVAWMDEHTPKDGEMLRFRAETAELLGIKGKTK